MFLKKIHLINFRNHVDFTTEFAPLVIILGPNGTGKTNILEAVYFALTNTSHRTSTIRDLINSDADFSRIELELEDQKIAVGIIKNLNKIERKITINDLKKKPRDLLGLKKTIIFSPESINIVIGSPNERRKFLNLILVQENKDYLNNLYLLQKILTQRNELLNRIRLNYAKFEELEIWDEKLIEINKELVNARTKLIEYFSLKISKYYNLISNSKNRLKILYLPSLPLDKGKNRLNELRSLEIKTGCTLSGPHRDEIKFEVNSLNVKQFASRGEARTFVLALKMVELQYFSRNNDYPLLLLDDVCSELDSDRVKHLLSLVSDCETIITATDLNEIMGIDKKKDTKIIRLK